MTLEQKISPEQMRLAHSNLSFGRKEEAEALEALYEEVFDLFGVTEKEIKSAERTKRVAWARQYLMWAIRARLGWTVQRIGKELGGRDHKTVCYGIRKAEDRAKSLLRMSAMKEAAR